MSQAPDPGFPQDALEGGPGGNGLVPAGADGTARAGSARYHPNWDQMAS